MTTPPTDLATEVLDARQARPSTFEVIVLSWGARLGALIVREALGRCVDEVVSVDRQIAALQARKAGVVDQARRRALRLEHTDTSPRPATLSRTG